MSLEKTCKIIAPIVITDSIVTSSNLTDAGIIWSPSTTYVIDEEVEYTATANYPGMTTSHIFIALTSGDSGHTPGDTDDPGYWGKYKATNEWGYRDWISTTYSERDDNITLEFTPGQAITGMYLIGIDADSVVIDVIADIRENKLVNGDFEENIRHWVDESLGTETPVWNSAYGGTAELTRTNSANTAVLTQTLTGTSGNKRTFTLTNYGGSGGNTKVTINGTHVLSVVPAATVTITFVSDGSDKVEIEALSDATTVYIQSTIVEEVDDVNTLDNGSFLGDIADWTDSSTGTGSVGYQVPNQLTIARVDSSNVGAVYQNVTAIAGRKYKYVVRSLGTAPGSGVCELKVNDVSVGNISIGTADTEFIVDASGTGTDKVEILGVTDGATQVIDYIIRTLYTQYNDTVDTTDQTEILITNLVGYDSEIITLTLDKLGSTVKLGQALIGTVTEVGYTSESISYGIIDYSKKEPGLYENSLVEKRGYSKTINYNILIERADINEVYDLISSIRATPTVFIGDEDIGQATLFGFFNDFSIDTLSYSLSNLNIDTEEL